MEEEHITNCWAIKTTSRSSGRDYWPLFVSESVIAIGWHEIDPGENAKHAKRMVKMFKDITVGDRVLICRGYSGNQRKDVCIYGFATVTGSFKDDKPLNGWRFTRGAKICRVETYVPVDRLRKALKMGSMRQTLHQINKEGFQQLKSQLCKHNH